MRATEHVSAVARVRARLATDDSSAFVSPSSVFSLARTRTLPFAILTLASTCLTLTPTDYLQGV